METTYENCKFKMEDTKIPKNDELMESEKKNLELNKEFEEENLVKTVKFLAFSMNSMVLVEDEKVLQKAKEMGFSLSKYDTENYGKENYIVFDKVVPNSEAHSIMKRVNKIKKYITNKIRVALFEWSLADRYDRINAFMVELTERELTYGSKVDNDLINSTTGIKFSFEWLKDLMKDLGYYCSIKEYSRDNQFDKAVITINWK